MSASPDGAAATSAPRRDAYPDALRAGALLVVVFGHWIATLPRVQDGRLAGTEHLLRVWDAAGALTWLVQVVPLFVFVSAAVSADGVERRLREGGSQRRWWAGRALGLARPTTTYLAVLAALALAGLWTGGRLLEPFNHSLTIHLWFLVMLLAVQALLPLCVRADRRFGLKAVAALVVAAAVADLLRAGVRGPGDLLALGARVDAAPGGIGWLNMLTVWLLPQQLGIAWRRGRLGGAGHGAALLLIGALWLAAAIASGYPVAMVGVALAGNNMLPPTLALVGVMWLQAGAVLLCEQPARRFLERHAVSRAIAVLGALGMPLYLWHKLAEVPAAWLGERLGAPIDAGDPGQPGFWLGRLCWLALCAATLAPVMAAAVAFELRRRRRLQPAAGSLAIAAGGAALFAGLAAALLLGAAPGAFVAVACVGAASWLLRAHPQPVRP
ncbi:acyltransferase family protein [Luteimonas huabeiensis]|uniref:acyltransferase family protein n=1 Tax=Luteimonas huabeiensis TaxID=1244513 RepID=UPI00046732CE|nr:acyltransferase [Luteimonas huabeiensis]